MEILQCHLDFNFYHWDCGLGESTGASHLKAPSRGVQCLRQVAPTTGSNLWSSPPPPRPKEEVFKVFEPKRVDSLLLPWYNFFIMVPRAWQQGANCPLCPMTVHSKSIKEKTQYQTYFYIYIYWI